MQLRHQQKLTHEVEAHTDRNMVLRILAESGNNQPFLILLTGAIGCREEEVCLLADGQLSGAGQAHAIRSGSAVLSQFLSRGAAHVVKDGGIITTLLFGLKEESHLAALHLPAQLNELPNAEVDMDPFGLTAAGGQVDIVGRKAKVYSPNLKSVVQALNKAVSCINTDDLVFISLVRHRSILPPRRKSGPVLHSAS